MTEYGLPEVFEIIDSTISCLRSQLAALHEDDIPAMICFIEDQMDEDVFKEGSTECFMRAILSIYHNKQF